MMLNRSKCKDLIISFTKNKPNFDVEYACQVWNFSAPEYLKEEIKRVQKRTLHIIYSHPSYRAALLETGILSLTQGRKVLCNSYLRKLLHPEHKLNELIPKKREFFAHIIYAMTII